LLRPETVGEKKRVKRPGEQGDQVDRAAKENQGKGRGKEFKPKVMTARTLAPNLIKCLQTEEEKSGGGV